MQGRISLKGTRRKVVATIGALVIVAGGTGVAVAATGVGTPQEESTAVIAAAAEDLGVSSAELSGALEQALGERVDAAVAAGRLTAAQGAEQKARIAAGELPLLGLGGGPRGHGHRSFGHFGGMGAAATFLGLTEAELHARLDSDTSLADLAKAEGKTVNGLVDALVAAATKEANAAVTSGMLTDGQRDEILTTLEERVTEHVNRSGFGMHPRVPAGWSPAGDAGVPAPTDAPDLTDA